MDIELTIDYDTLQYEIDLQSYYKGEACKREDVNADLPQTSTDQNDILHTYLHKACNEAASICAKRMSNVEYSMNENDVSFACSPTEDKNAYIVPLLQKALTDYLVYYVLYLWMLTMKEEWANTYIVLLSNGQHALEKLLGMLYNGRVRRRPTDLAGI